VKNEIEENLAASNKKIHILDPFAGSGTVLIESEKLNIPAIGIEAHPFVARIARIKIGDMVNVVKLINYSENFLNIAKLIKADIDFYPDLIRKCYSDENLIELDQLRRAWLSIKNEQSSELIWLAIVAILRQCSSVGTASWQYILPKKKKFIVANPFKAYQDKINQIICDISLRPKITEKSLLVQGDAREMNDVPDKWVSLVITSPPYPNNFDYADATRLEMSFFGEIAGWGDLQESVRRYLIRSCIQHVSSLVKDTTEILASSELEPIRNDITVVVESLYKRRGEYKGRKNYHTMIAAYFLDMAKVWKEIYRCTTENARICFIIGDSAPYSVHIPVDEWIGRIALATGFQSYLFTKIRNRNIKWKNRKHRIPLHEGKLLVEKLC
jgi:DNA modification methylase